ncbi:hypothetical protein [Acidovorax sp.]|uniref:hypothetical protein n=1 Tax=Acidovorax sp. TaxID=1872122 RepID=UPI002ACD7D77|nr:hypothetical protein [Acidovorax sp.]MDZ7863370.1 hypothetical protein [Acidovorax sp.]
MQNFKQLLDSKKPGEVFSVDPQTLALSEEQFDAVARDWVREGGGDGFSIQKPHRESMTGERRYDLMLLKKNG